MMAVAPQFEWPPGSDAPPADAPPLVGVVIPMFNGARTIGATLASVCTQSYANLDIIVVDDGSTDDSVAQVERWMAREPRLRLIRQVNAGVAAARNFGATHTIADYLGFIDADDLWAPAKIALQMAAMLEGGEAVGLAYSWFAYVDENDRVFSLEHHPEVEGEALRAMCQTNVVGNGSSALFRRTAFEEAGGFDSTLRDRDAQGCEDLAICLRVAENYEFRVIRRHLTGYRLSPDNMSSDVRRMARSCEIVLGDYRRRYPEYAAEIDHHLLEMTYWLIVRAASAGRYAAGLGLARAMLASAPGVLLRRMPNLLVAVARARAPTPIKRLAHALRHTARGGSGRYLDRSW